MREAIAEGRAALAEVDDPVERLRRIARLHLAGWAAIATWRWSSRWSCGSPPSSWSSSPRRPFAEYLGIIRDAIADGQVRGLFRRNVSATVAAKVFFGALDEMATNWVLSQRRYSLVADADVVVDLFFNGVKA